MLDTHRSMRSLRRHRRPLGAICLGLPLVMAACFSSSRSEPQDSGMDVVLQEDASPDATPDSTMPEASPDQVAEASSDSRVEAAAPDAPFDAPLDAPAEATADA